MKRALLQSAPLLRAARRLVKKNPERIHALQTALDALTNDAFQPALKTHKLNGEFAGSWACSAGYDTRIIFEFVQHEGAEAIQLQTIGTHDEVY